MKRCFIFGALNVEKILAKPAEQDLVIAADKGYLNIEKFGITPDLVVGDFDSLGYVPDFQNKIVLPVKKDLTDTAVALNYALDKGYRDIVVYGAAEGKTDHAFANITLCAALSIKGINTVFYGQNTHFTAVTNGSVCFKNARGRVSVFAMGGSAAGVTLKGFAYELDNATLDSFVPLGVSNSFKGDTSAVTVENGTLVIMWENDVEPQW